jgi:hypothetical protein
MYQQLKKYGSLFLLLLFLFPLVEKEIHNYEHTTDEHCLSTDAHFHTERHNCSICDYTLSNPHFITDADVVIICTSHHFSFHPFTESIHSPAAFQDLPSRAPPVC